MQKVAILALFIAATLPPAGCKGKEAIKDATKAVRTVSENAVEASKNIENGLTELGKIDPLALGKVLDENKDLREKLQRQQQQLLSYAGAFVELQLDDRKLFFRPIAFSGDFDVQAFIDTPDNVILDRAFRQLRQKVSRRSATAWRQSTLQPIYLDESLFGYGTRQLWISVTPRDVGPKGALSFRAQLVTRSPDGTEDVVRDYDWELRKDQLVLGNLTRRAMIVRVARPTSSQDAASTPAARPTSR